MGITEICNRYYARCVPMAWKSPEAITDIPWDT